MNYLIFLPELKKYPIKKAENKDFHKNVEKAKKQSLSPPFW